MRLAMLTLAAAALVCPLAGAQSATMTGTAPTAAQLAQMDVQRYVMVLGLSSTQQEEALTIFTTEETAEVSIRTAEQTAEKALLTAIEANDSGTIATLSATLGGLHGQDILARATASAAFYAILTTEQQTKFAQILQMGGMDGNGPGGMGGPPRR